MECASPLLIRQTTTRTRGRADASVAVTNAWIESELSGAVRAAALRFAGAGTAVFPCVSLEKRPLTEHGFLDATTDAEQVAEWFRRWPDANLAVPTGAPGYDVLDVDVRGGASGWFAYHQAREAGLTAGWTHAVRTPSGGLHLYYPGTDQRSASLSSRHLDFRGVGGYVVVPPSRVRTETYAGDYELIARNDKASRELDWSAVRELVAPPTSPRAAQGAGPTAATPPAVTDWLARWLTGQSEGNRNQALFWAACRAAERGVADSRPLVAAAVSIGLTEREATTTVRSAYRRSGRPDHGNVPTAVAAGAGVLAR